MRLLCPNDSSVCLPMRIIEAEKEFGARLGGDPPEGISPTLGGSRYFASVPVAVDPALHVSIFVNDFEELLSMRGRIRGPGGVQVVIHPPARRSPIPNLRSALTPRGLRVLTETEDSSPDDDGEPVVRSGHKIGGMPHLIREKPELVRGIRALLDDNYLHVAQFDFPDSEDADISGSWPFGDGIFNLFGKQPFDAEAWRWFWDF